MSYLSSLSPSDLAAPSKPPQLPVSALVVEPSLPDALSMIAAFSAASFQLAITHTFHEARLLLDAAPPTVLITSVRLGEYNGLHLVLRARDTRPHLAMVVTSDRPDPVLQAEAERLQATFVVRPLPQADLVAAVLRTVGRRQAEQGVPIRAPFERRQRERRLPLGHLYDGPDRRQTERRAGILAPAIMR